MKTDNPLTPGQRQTQAARDALTPEQRSQRARIANAIRWSQVPPEKRAAQTAKARAARFARYLDAVPEEVTDEAERVKLARQAEYADLLRMSLRASRARSAKAAARKVAS